MTDDNLDADGYPTPACLEKITAWPYTDPGWFEFIFSVWAYNLSAWEKDDTAFDKLDNPIIRHSMSTCGWSGNESIIEAMQNNFLWDLCWVQSRRGGHYIFEVRK